MSVQKAKIYRRVAGIALRVLLTGVVAALLNGCNLLECREGGCPAGTSCGYTSDGYKICEVSYCQVDSDCSGGYVCLRYDWNDADGRCAQCRTNAHCPPGDYCASNHRCLDRSCSIDQDCAVTGPDLVCSTGNGTSAQTPPPAGVFEDGGLLHFGATYTAQAAFGNLDNDRDIDVFSAEAVGPDRVFFNQDDTPGQFLAGLQTLGDGASTSVALADIDNDGDLDAAVGKVSGGIGVQLWINEGSGTFIAGQEIGSLSTQAVAFGDLDNDGDPDMVQGHDGSNAVNPNRPELTTWHLTEQGIYAPFSPGSAFGVGSNFITVAIELGDLDGDGDLDIFTASGGAPRVWMNQAGALADVQTLDAGLGTRSEDIALVDFDFDGDLDAIVANNCDFDDIGTDACSNHVWLNQGRRQLGQPGVFLDSGQRLGTSQTTSVAVGSAAGQINVFFGNTAMSNEIWVVDRSGVLHDTGQVIGASGATRDIAAVDIDGDGDNELISFNFAAGNNTYGTGGGSSDIGECIECLNDSQCGSGKICLNEQCWTSVVEALTAGQTQAQQGTGEGETNPVVFSLQDHRPGADTAHLITIEVAEGDLQLYSIIINYPLAFEWKGFNALGPAGTEVGSQMIDTNDDGSPEFEFKLLSYDGSTAYGDIDADFTPVSNALMGYKRLSSHRLNSFLPYGGDLDPTVSKSPVAHRAKLLLHSGVMSNPTVEGDYAVRFRAVTVDPDTGGADDGQGESPMLLDRTFVLRISDTLFQDGFEGNQ